uniref:Uncharacterized protein n=1 Tax=Candidatus Kentrum sp. FM TaxID=2126340 RepID=A0A450TTY5_9GAMM|nr:MAG: hypothetical protein BECKFM1743A_GA0114220_106226 [Candidatus Kentron sp. FM]
MAHNRTVSIRAVNKVVQCSIALLSDLGFEIFDEIYIQRKGNALPAWLGLEFHAESRTVEIRLGYLGVFIPIRGGC